MAKATNQAGESIDGAGEKTFCEFFAGIGLVREGLIGSGWSCVYANDIDPKKRELYEGRFGVGSHFHEEDVWQSTEIVGRIPESPFLATASFPCVDLSLAGHWRGFDGEHSSTFFGFANVLDLLGAKKPKLVMLENVTGFLTSQGGKDFASAVQTLADLGYWIDAFVLDAKNFVPQSRPRVFVIGIHESIKPGIAIRKTRLDWIFDEWSARVEAAPTAIRPRKLLSLMRSIELKTGWTAVDLTLPTETRPHLTDLIDLDDGQAWWDQATVFKHHDMMNSRHRKLVDELLNNRTAFVETIFRRKRGGKTWAEVRFDGTAGCLRTPKGGSAKQIIIALNRGEMRMRWMSAREYARLQGADDFPLVSNTIQNLFGFGDAVCVPVIRWIDKHTLTPIQMSESAHTTLGSVTLSQPAEAIQITGSM